MSDWFNDNFYWLLPVFVAAVAQWEITKLNKRIDALILLLKRQGVDIYRQSPDFSDLD